VPSLDQILQPTAVTRLRNQLLEAEYYQLGVEVRQDKVYFYPHSNEWPLLNVINRCCHLLVVLTMGRYPGQDQLVSVGITVSGEEGSSWLQGDGIGLEETLRRGCRHLSPKGAIFPPGFHKDWA
jgi:hypothetical protein